jgi:hypothetical protein
VLSGSVATTWDPATGDERLDYVHHGLAEVSITGGGRRPLLLLLADDDTAGTFWRQDTSAGPVLERGPELVRTASVSGSRLQLTGDISQPTDLEVWAPAVVRSVTWNGSPTAVAPTSSGSLSAHGQLAGPAAISLPDLSSATWRTAPGSPEADPGFDDSSWASADKTQTNSTTPPPAGQPVLTADDYGFHHGDVWYRGRYSGATSATTVSLRYGGGGAGMLQAWLDGHYLGQNVLPTGISSPPTTGTATFAIPASLQTAGQHELSVMVRDDSHNEDGGINDAQKEGRGLISLAMADGSATPVAAPVSWKIQGDQGGEDITDPVRGPINNGGLYGERAGWYLPGYLDRGWTSATVPASGASAGTTWYRTTFRLRIPPADDASLGLTIGDPSVARSSGDYRALIFVNGWNMGQYIANVGPQHTFVVPNGVLDPDGQNTLAIAVTSDGGSGNGLERVALTNLGTVRGGVPLTLDNSPGYAAPRLTPGHLRATAGHKVSGTVAGMSVPPDALGTVLGATVQWGDGSSSPGEVIGSGAQRTVQATHSYRWPGLYRPRVLINDAVAGTALVTGQATVSLGRP